MKLQPKASNRQIAKVLGVNPATVDRDVAAANAADSKEKPKKNKGANKQPAAFAAGALSGAAAAAVESEQTKDERKARSDDPSASAPPSGNPSGAGTVLGSPLEMGPKLHTLPRGSVMGPRGKSTSRIFPGPHLGRSDMAPPKNMVASETEQDPYFNGASRHMRARPVCTGPDLKTGR